MCGVMARVMGRPASTMTDGCGIARLLRMTDNMALSLFAETAYDPDLNDVIGRSWAVLGMTGSGKSNSVARKAEQCLIAGIPLCVMDIAGEYWGLKERFALVVAGKSSHVDVPVEMPEQAASLAIWSLQERVSVVFDISGFRPKALRLAMVNAYLTALWEASIDLRRPCVIILEEAHNYIPQSTPTTASEIVTTLATEGRKNGLSLVMVSQRPARLDKDVLSQASVRLLHRVFDPNDVKAYQSVIPQSAWDKEKVMALETGEAMLVYPQKRICQPVHVLPRETYHGGATPGMDDVQPPALTGLPEDTLKALSELLSKKQPTQDNNPARLQAVIDDLCQRVEELSTENLHLREENAMLSKLRVDMVAPEQLNVDKLVIGTGLTSEPITPTPTSVTSEYRSPLAATTRGMNKQQKEFEILLRAIGTGAKSHRAILAYLLQHTQLEWFTTHELVRYVGYQERTLKSNPPMLMLRYGLLERDTNRLAGIQRYSVRGIAAQLKKRFPDLDTDALIQRILKVCQ